MSIDRGTPPTEPRTAQQNYERWAATFQDNSHVDSEGHLFVDVPELWMAAIPVIDILDRAARAEKYNLPITCHARITDGVTCDRPLNHEGSHVGTRP